MTKSFFIIFLLLLLFSITACSNVVPPLTNSSHSINSSDSSAKDLFLISSIAKCDRFRPIFEKELKYYPIINSTFDISTIYALIYQESACESRDELEQTFKERNDIRETWKGGLMQVDSCWRCVQYCADCSTIDSQIHNGMSVLNNVITGIDAIALKNNLTLSREQKAYAVLLSYNRGTKLVEHAFEIYSHKLAQGNYVVSGVVSNDSGLYVFVNCTEKPLCSNDGEFILIEQNYTEDSFVQSLLLGCRMEYGFKRDLQGDYCTGIGYGLEYSKDVLKIRENILMNIPDIDTIPMVALTGEYESYIGEIFFSNYSWFIKYSATLRGPGPNLFYHDNNSIFVDKTGAVHLKIQNINGTWYSTEIVLTKSLGYGVYSFNISGTEELYDKNVVMGIFTYDLTDTDKYHREIDFELAKWGVDEENTAQLTIQGPQGLMPLTRFRMDYTTPYNLLINWTEHNVLILLSNDSEIIKSWNYSGEYVPKKGDEHLRINFWLFNSTPPTIGQDYEVVITQFSHQ